MRKQFNKSKTLNYLTEYLIYTVNEIKSLNVLSSFNEGELLAFIETLEILSKWKGFKKYGIKDIEKEFGIV